MHTSLAGRRPDGATVSSTDVESIALAMNSTTLHQFYCHVLQNHRLAEPNTDEARECAAQGYLVVVFDIELDAENTPPTSAAIVTSTKYELGLKHKRGVEVYRVHILDVGKFVDEWMLAILRQALSSALTDIHYLLPQHLIATIKAPVQT